MEFETDSNKYLGEALEPGIIVGIGLAAAIIIVALILLAIYLCIRARKQSLKENAAMHYHHGGESSVYTSGRVALETHSVNNIIIIWMFYLCLLVNISILFPFPVLVLFCHVSVGFFFADVFFYEYVYDLHVK